MSGYTLAPLASAQQPDGLCRRKVAKVDRGVFVGLACSRSLTDNREVGQ